VRGCGICQLKGSPKMPRTLRYFKLAPWAQLAPLHFRGVRPRCQFKNQETEDDTNFAVETPCFSRVLAQGANCLPRCHEKRDGACWHLGSSLPRGASAASQEVTKMARSLPLFELAPRVELAALHLWGATQEANSIHIYPRGQPVVVERCVFLGNYTKRPRKRDGDSWPSSETLKR
jgi:hypothetical protein